MRCKKSHHQCYQSRNRGKTLPVKIRKENWKIVGVETNHINLCYAQLKAEKAKSFDDELDAVSMEWDEISWGGLANWCTPGAVISRPGLTEGIKDHNTNKTSCPTILTHSGNIFLGLFQFYTVCPVSFCLQRDKKGGQIRAGLNGLSRG